MSATGLHPYWMNMLLHTALLSLVALPVAACFKNPHARSLSAALGLLSLSIIPWISVQRISGKKAVVEIPIAPVSISKPIPAPIVTSMDAGAVTVRKTTFPPAEPPEFKLPDPWTLLAGIWALGCAVQITRQIMAAIRLAQWKSSLREATVSEIRILRNHSSGLPNSCRIRISAAGTSPCVTGFLHPTLVFPENLLAPDRQRELNWALRHETAHLHANDLRWLALFQLILAVHWWNPIAHRLVRIWADAREWVCDNLALSDPQDRAAYGTFLVSMGARRPSGPMIAMADRGPLARFKQRIRFLMEGGACTPCGHKFIANSALLAILVGFCVAQLGVKAETPTPAPEPPHDAVHEKTEPKTDEAAPIENNPPQNIQIKFSSQFFVTSTPIATLPGDLSPVIYDQKRWLPILRELAQKRGTTLMTAPSVTALPRQNAMIEIIREGPANHSTPIPANAVSSTRQSPAIDDPDYQFAGIRMEFTPEVQGEQINMNCRLAYGHIPGSNPADFDKVDLTKIPWDKVHTFRAECRELLKPTEHLLVPVGEIDPGRHLTLVVSAVPIDATGRPVDATGEPIATDETDEPPARPATPLPPLPPFTVRVSGWLATIDAQHRGKQLKPSNMPAPCFFDTATDELISEIRDAAKGTVVSLPGIELGESDVPLKLWDNLPEFGASFTRSDLPHLASFFWGYHADTTQPAKVTGSIGVVGSHCWCFELPPEITGTRRFLMLNFEMNRK